MKLNSINRIPLWIKRTPNGILFSLNELGSFLKWWAHNFKEICSLGIDYIQSLRFDFSVLLQAIPKQISTSGTFWFIKLSKEIRLDLIGLLRWTLIEISFYLNVKRDKPSPDNKWVFLHKISIHVFTQLIEIYSHNTLFSWTYIASHWSFKLNQISFWTGFGSRGARCSPLYFSSPVPCPIFHH